MSPSLALTCVNCGTALQQPAPGVTSVRCPVCQLLNDVHPAVHGPVLTRDALERSLGDLIAQARNSGLNDEAIMAALRDELEFTAEMSYVGRQISVQIVDLGPLEGQMARPPVRDRAATLRSRALSG